MGGSRANVYLETAFFEDVAHEDYAALLRDLTDAPVPANHKGIGKCLGMDIVG